MAVAEARAAWQRAANRCFVQEDAKRAPKLACCQSSSSTSKKVEVETAGEIDVQDQNPEGFMAHNVNTTYFNLPPDTRWWLQMQPGHGYQKGLPYEHINAFENEVESCRGDSGITPSKLNVTHQQKGDSTNRGSNSNTESFVDIPCIVSNVHSMKNSEIRKEEVKPVDIKDGQELLKLMDIEENYKLIDMDPVGYASSKGSNELCIDPESPWHGKRSEPWWRTTVKDELAILVSKKSLDHIENCDLPPPQKMHVRRQPFSPLGCFDDEEVWPSSLLDQSVQSSHLYSPTVKTQGFYDSGRIDGREWISAEGTIGCGSEKTHSYIPTQKKFSGARKSCESDSGKAQLLEALCHSQTRARKAENAAKQAVAEKEHIIKLFLRQASQLFAYKQWLQLLQLETLYLQIKNSDQPISTIFPVSIPWMPNNGQNPQRRPAKAKQRKRGRPRNEIKNYAIAIALGLGLVGAGLLLGWTIGWMLPF